MSTAELEILLFKSSLDFEKWLEQNHDKSPGVWLRFYKKSSSLTSITYLEAVHIALCYGWIDSQAKGYDDASHLQRFGPRRTKSMWSKINVERTERLIKEGKMKPAGFLQIEAAKKDDRWQQAYDSPKTMVIPADFLEELSKNKKAETFFLSLNKTNTYTIAWRLQTAKKPETREKRMKVLLEMMAKGEKFY